MSQETNKLNDMLKQATEKTEPTKSTKEHKPMTDKQKKIIGISAGAILLLGLGIGGLSTLTNNKPPVVKETGIIQDNSDSRDNADSRDESVSTSGRDGSSNTRIAPIKIPDWSSKPYKSALNTKDTKAIKAAIRNTKNTSDISRYTENISSEKDKDYIPGTYSREMLEYDYNYYMQRLLNPVFGGWDSLKKGQVLSKNYVNNTFEDMFKGDWYNFYVQGQNKRLAYIPVYADWTGNMFGGKLQFSESYKGPYWGEVKSAFIDTSDISKGIKISADIEYTALLKGNKKDIKHGRLNMTLVPDKYTATNGTSSLITDPELVMK